MYQISVCAPCHGLHNLLSDYPSSRGDFTSRIPDKATALQALCCSLQRERSDQILHYMSAAVSFRHTAVAAQAKKVKGLQAAFKVYNIALRTPGKGELTMVELRVRSTL